MAIRLMADDVFLAEVFDSDHGVRHRKMTDDGRPTTDRRPSAVLRQKSVHLSGKCRTCPSYSASKLARAIMMISSIA
jgi:hypothetical protein